MNKYIIRFLTVDNVLGLEWIEANSDSEALGILEKTNINVKKILSVTEV